MSHIITFLLTGTVPPPPTHPGPPPIPPCNECPVGCENGNEPEQGMQIVEGFSSTIVEKS